MAGPMKHAVSMTNPSAATSIETMSLYSPAGRREDDFQEEQEPYASGDEHRLAPDSVGNPGRNHNEGDVESARHGRDERRGGMIRLDK